MAVLRRVPQEELERFAREEYVRRYAAVPKPKPLNVEALVSLGAPRLLRWSGLQFRAPPLSFALGKRILVCVNALRELREARAPEPVRWIAARDTATVLRRALWPRWSRWAIRGTPDEVEHLANWLLDVPDDTALPPIEVAVRMDFVDTLAAFVREFPAWVGTNGDPISWAHYQYGLRHLVRARHREDLRAALTARIAQADPKAYKEFVRDWRAMAEV